MRAVILSLVLAAAALAQPIPPPAAVLKGTPPGGSGGACNPAAMLGYLASDGNLYVCTGTPSTVWTSVGSGGITAPLVVLGQIASGSNATVAPLSNLLYPGTYVSSVLSSQQTYTAGDVNGYAEGALHYLLLNTNANTPNTDFFGLDTQVQTQSGNARNFGVLAGAYAQGTHAGTGTVNGVHGIQLNVANLSSGTINNAYNATLFGVQNWSTGTVTNAYGMDIGANTNHGAGTITNSYGLLLEAQSAGTIVNYNLLSLGAGSHNKFEGNVEVGSLTMDSAPTLPNGTTGTTQSPNDNSTKVATTAYVDAAGGGGTPAPPYLTISGTAYGPLFAMTKPPSSDWTWANQGSSTASTTNGAITFLWKHAGSDALRAYLQAVPSSSAFTLSIGTLTASPNLGICVTDGTKYGALFFVNGNTYHFDKWNTTTSNASSTSLPAISTAPLMWLRIVLSSSTYTYYASADGINWNTVTTDSSGFLGTPASAGPCAYAGPSGASFDLVGTLAHFTFTTP